MLQSPCSQKVSLPLWLPADPPCESQQRPLTPGREVRDLPYPESVAAARFTGGTAEPKRQRYFANMGFGAFMFLLGQLNVFQPFEHISWPVKIAALESAASYQHESQCVTNTIAGGATLKLVALRTSARLGDRMAPRRSPDGKALRRVLSIIRLSDRSAVGGDCGWSILHTFQNAENRRSWHWTRGM